MGSRPNTQLSQAGPFRFANVGRQPPLVAPSAPSQSTRMVRIARAVTTRALLGLIRLYQLTLSPLVGGQCRFHPTCSHYAMQALTNQGVFKGSWLALKRLAKCHPFHPGGVDLPPEPNG